MADRARPTPSDAEARRARDAGLPDGWVFHGQTIECVRGVDDGTRVTLTLEGDLYFTHGPFALSAPRAVVEAALGIAHRTANPDDDSRPVSHGKLATPGPLGGGR